MASIVLSSAGSAIGGAVGGPIGAFVGGQIGKLAGGYIDGKVFGSETTLKTRNGPRLGDLGVQVSTYGKMIPIVYGNVRLAGNIIWSRPIKETVTTTTSSSSSGSKGGGGGGSGGRELLTADRTYYVRSDGSNSNNGLANTSGGAFLTLQKAIDVVGSLDLGIYDVTIQIGTGGTYAGASVSGTFVGGAGSSVSIVGDTGSPSSYVISSQIHVTNNAFLNISGVDFTTSDYGLNADYGGVITMNGACVFGACSVAHVNASYGGKVLMTANCTIDGGSTHHILAQYNSFIFSAGLTVTLSGTPNFSSFFANAESGSNIQANSNSYSGSATGNRYNVALNGVINTLGGGATYFPGNAGGSTATGGQYV